MLEALVKKERKFKEKKLTKNAETKLENNFKNKKIKTIIDFDRKECNSIKPIALKANTNIKIISRFSFFFNRYLAVPRPTLGHSQGGSLTNLMVNTAFVHVRPEGHREHRNEVGSLSPAERLAGFESGTFRF